MNRRTFLRTSGLTAGGLLLSPRFARAHRSPNDALDVGVIGVANRGAANLAGVAGENVVALCDVDAGYLAAAGERHPNAARFTDFRRMFDAVSLDAVVVSTPDHVHACATTWALEAGLPVYCEKPLTRTVGEARRVTERARELGVATQMGTQIHSGSNYRRVVELVRSGAIGAVREVHVFCGKTWGATDAPGGVHQAPSSLDWDTWLGPAPDYPYNPAYHPAGWRRYRPFGAGTIGDMACHYVDLPFWALELDDPTRVVSEGPEPHAFACPTWIVTRWSFPQRGERPPVELFWYDGGRRPAELAALGASGWGNGVLFLGERGGLLADYSRHVLLPEEEFADFEPPAPTIPESIGHHAEWIDACKTGSPTTCSFDYSGPLTETVLLGLAAHTLGRPIDWDASALRIRADGVASEHAEAVVDAPWRDGWDPA